MPRMEKTDERRAEQRLHYRWPVRFASDPGEKPLSGQMFDLSSKGMAMLFHANKDCPRCDQSITANFGVPHFNAHGLFDTSFFNRAGRVCRVDKLTSRVNRVAIRFAEPLFFKPGEQGITESDARQRLDAYARSVAAGQARASGESRTRPEAEPEDQSQIRQRENADARAKIEAERRAVAEAQARENARFYEREIAKVRAEAAREIARLKDETSYKIAEAKAEVRAKLLAQKKAEGKKDPRGKKADTHSRREGIVKKVDEFLTDRSQIY